MDMIVVLLGLVILLVLTLKKVPVIYAAAISVVFIAIFSKLPVVDTMTNTYMTGFANFVKSSWLMLLLGAILSKVMDVTGAARSIAAFIIGKLGVKFAIPAIVIAGGLLTYGGVSRNTVFHDTHDMGGMTEEDAKKWAPDMDLNYYIGIEGEFNAMAEKYNKMF